MPRWVPVLAVALILCGCGREPDFDQRYEEAETAIREKAAAIDAEFSEVEKPGEGQSADPSAAAREDLSVKPD